MEDTLLTQTVDSGLFIEKTPINWDYLMTFHNKDNKEIGRLSLKNNKIKFKGNADKSAKVFFEYCLKGYVDEYIKEQIRKEKKNK